MTTIELEEHRSWVGALPSGSLDELTLLAGDRLAITRLVGGRVEVRATSHVGVLVTSDLTVRIRPKVDLDNLFYMLGVGDEAWRVEQASAPYAAVDDDLVTAVARLFCREVDVLTSRGLLHGYVRHDERLLAIRGRVDLGTVMRRPWERTPVPCQFDEFVPDVWVNQVLLAALACVRRVPTLPPQVRGEVHLLSQRFEGVSAVTIDLARLDAWKPTRNDQRYQVAMTLASVILRHLSLADRSGGAQAASFTIDMNALFEDFVGRELSVRLPAAFGLTEQYPTHFDTGKRLAIRPDFVVHPANRSHDALYVADAKYKLTERLGVIGDHYQLLAYATVFGLREGVLIYCQKADDDDSLEVSPVSSIRVRGAGIEHFVYRLDVSGTRADIAARLDALMVWIRGRIAEQTMVLHSEMEASVP